MPAIGDPGEDVVDLTDRHRRSMSRAAARAEGRQRAGIAPESLAATRADLSETSWPEPEPALVRGPTEVGVIAMVGPFPRAVLRSRSMGNQVIVASPRRPPGTASSDWIRNAALAQARALRWRERGELVVVAVDSGADPDWLDEVLRALGPIRIERMDHDDQ